MTNFCFNSGDKKFIAITRCCTIWPSSQENHKLSFHKVSLKLAINYILENSYFNLGCTYVLLPIDWDPCGIWPIPFYDNLIFVLLWKEVSSPAEELEMRKARIFSNIFRFINDLCKFSNDEFERTEGKWRSL